MKKILVLGASGRTGTLVVEKALAAGKLVNAIVRNTEAIKLSHENLTLFEGTPTDSQIVNRAIEGCSAVICTMNNSRAADSPFAKVINSPTLLTDSIKNVTTAMKQHGVSRVVMLGAAGTSDSFATAPWFMKLMIKYTNLGHAYRDHEGVETVLRNSGVDWTIGRAMMLGKKVGKNPIIESYVVGNENIPKPSMQISRDSVAQWLLDSLDRSDLIAKAPLISQS